MARSLLDQIDRGVQRTLLVAGFLGLAAIAALPAAASDKADFSALKNTGLIPGHSAEIVVNQSARDAGLLTYTPTLEAGARPLLTIQLESGDAVKALLRPDRLISGRSLSADTSIRRDEDRSLLGDFELRD